MVNEKDAMNNFGLTFPHLFFFFWQFHVCMKNILITVTPQPPIYPSMHRASTQIPFSHLCPFIFVLFCSRLYFQMFLVCFQKWNHWMISPRCFSVATDGFIPVNVQGSQSLPTSSQHLVFSPLGFGFSNSCPNTCKVISYCAVDLHCFDGY